MILPIICFTTRNKSNQLENIISDNQLDISSEISKGGAHKMFWGLFKLMLRLVLLPLMFIGTLARFAFFLLVPMAAMKILRLLVRK